VVSSDWMKCNGHTTALCLYHTCVCFTLDPHHKRIAMLHWPANNKTYPAEGHPPLSSPDDTWLWDLCHPDSTEQCVEMCPSPEVARGAPTEENEVGYGDLNIFGKASPPLFSFPPAHTSHSTLIGSCLSPTAGVDEDWSSDSGAYGDNLEAPTCQLPKSPSKQATRCELQEGDGFPKGDGKTKFVSPFNIPTRGPCGDLKSPSKYWTGYGLEEDTPEERGEELCAHKPKQASQQSSPCVGKTCFIFICHV
jgi:hypothetical protein